MKRILVLMLLCLGSLLQSQTYNGPESVVYDPAGKRYFISNNGANQILQRDSSGQLSVFSTAISSGPHGLEIANNTLYACDGGSVKGFNLANGTQVMNLATGGTFLNGICFDGSNFLYVSDFSAKRIYKINISAQSSSQYINGLVKSPNGMIFDGNNQRLIWVTWGSNAPIMQASLADSAAAQLKATSLGNCDGIVRDNNGNYYVSAWSTQSVHRFDSTFTSTPTVAVSGLSNPADIYYNTENDSLVSPNAGNNTVTFHYLGTTSPTAVHQNIQNDLRFYPNPASDFIYLENSTGENLSAEIYDLTGRKLLSFENLSSDRQQIDISGLEKGLYVLRVFGKGLEKVGLLGKE
jgi:sugar lactone lactonase YvrE